MANAIVPTRSDDMMFLPVMDMDVAIARRNHVVEFVKKIMVEGTDFGKIPGAGDKPTLLKPGAEKLSTFFGLTPVFISVGVVEDWTGDDHKGEPFFYYRYKCELHRNGNLIASSEGSCNTWESKYRYRKAERTCPQCGAAAIIKGKKEYGGGWICFGRKGGCGAKYSEGDPVIESQEVGRVANPDVADQVNTAQKMAQKRALIAATLLAVNASEFFTQDIEDMVIDAEWTPVVEKPTQAPQKAQDESKATTPHERMWGMGMAVFGRDWDMAREWLIAKWTSKVTPDNTRNSASELNDTEKAALADYLNDHANALQKVWPTQKRNMNAAATAPVAA